MDAGTMYANAKALHELLQEERVESAKLRHDLEEANNQAEEGCIENAKLRELVRDMWHDGMCECDERGACAECEYHYTDRMRELGIEVSDG